MILTTLCKKTSNTRLRLLRQAYFERLCTTLHNAAQVFIIYVQLSRSDQCIPMFTVEIPINEELQKFYLKNSLIKDLETLILLNNVYMSCYLLDFNIMNIDILNRPNICSIAHYFISIGTVPTEVNVISTI